MPGPAPTSAREMFALFGLEQSRLNSFFSGQPIGIDEEELLAFYDFPDVHWTHIRTTNPIESTFATVRLRSKRAKNCGSRETTLAMVYKLLETAQKRWRRIQGFNLLTLVVNNVIFKNGKQEDEQSTEKAA